MGLRTNGYTPEDARGGLRVSPSARITSTRAFISGTSFAHADTNALAAVKKQQPEAVAPLYAHFDSPDDTHHAGPVFGHPMNEY